MNIESLDIGLKSGVDLGICKYPEQLGAQSSVHSAAYVAAMKTSKLARETAKVATSISQADFVPRRQTRGFAASLQAFTYKGEVAVQSGGKGVKREPLSDGDNTSLSSLGSASLFDIEDAPFTASSTRKRKRGVDSPSTAMTSISTATSTRTSPRKGGLNDYDGTVARITKAKRQPAKRILNEVGEEELEPPANWEEIYDAVKEMRKDKLAPVDTMGCETLAEEHLTPRVSRAQHLRRNNPTEE